MVDQTSSVTHAKEDRGPLSTESSRECLRRKKELFLEKAYYEQNQPVQLVISCGDSFPLLSRGMAMELPFILPKMEHTLLSERSFQHWQVFVWRNYYYVELKPVYP